MKSDNAQSYKDIENFILLTDLLKNHLSLFQKNITITNRDLHF